MDVKKIIVIIPKNHKVTLKKLILYSLTTFILLAFVNLIQIYENLNNYEAANYKKKEKQIDIIINDTHRLSNSLFDNVINTKKVIDIFKKADSSNEEEKAKIRKELYDSLIDNYENFKNYGIQQLHFHLPNNDSFLRFHQPLKFADNLTNVRESVKFVNENKVPIIGFEEGRIYNGYRFVYPLKYNDKYLGSVETSVSMESIMNDLKKELSSELSFIIKKSVVDNTIFEEEKDNYVQCSINNDFYHEKSISKDENEIMGTIIKEYFEKNPTQAKNNLKSGEIFNFYSFYKNNYYITTYLPIKNVV